MHFVLSGGPKKNEYWDAEPICFNVSNVSELLKEPSKAKRTAEGERTKRTKRTKERKERKEQKNIVTAAGKET